MAKKKNASGTIEQRAKQAVGSLKKDTGGFIIYNHKVLSGFIVTDNRIIGFLMDNSPFEPGEILEHAVLDAEFMVVDSLYVGAEEGDEMLEDVMDIVKAYDLQDKYGYANRLDLFARNGDINIDPNFQIVYVEQIPEEEANGEILGQ
jgi:hypothetical protein